MKAKIEKLIKSYEAEIESCRKSDVAEIYRRVHVLKEVISDLKRIIEREEK